jgi:L-fuculose-phosphate aldolase
MLHFSARASEAELRDCLVHCGRICYERNLMTSNDGNLSVRLDPARLLITPAGISKGRMRADDLLLIGLDGQVLTSPGGTRPSSEAPMHLEVYRSRPEARAVIHAHPIFATALTVAGLDFPLDVLPESVMALGEVPVTPYATPSSDEDAEAIRPFVLGHAAILLRQHGAVTIGADLEEALQHLERLEHVAEVFWRAHMLGHVEHLTAGARERLLAARARQSEK